MGSIFTGFFFLDSLTLEDKYYHYVFLIFKKGVDLIYFVAEA